jgi:riboflavin kinase / FMN adenylyltransferase
MTKTPQDPWDSYKIKNKSWVVALGNFDGVHRGHQELIKKALALAHSYESERKNKKKSEGNSESNSEREIESECVCESVGIKVISFDPHPKAFFSPPHTLIMSLSKQKKKLQALGCEEVVHIPFDQALSETSAQDFLDKVLPSYGRIRGIVVGCNFRFGQNREGDGAFLKKWSLSQNPPLVVEIVSPVTYENFMVSTSWLRDLLISGDLPLVRQMLGSDLEYEGLVVPGDGRGRGLGFPTLNIEKIHTQLPGPGVYAGLIFLKRSPQQEGDYREGDYSSDKKFNQEYDERLHREQSETLYQEYQHVVHIGPLPTFGVSSQRVEIHILDFKGDLYNQVVTFSLSFKIRGVLSFSSPEELKQQIAQDILFARKYLLP